MTSPENGHARLRATVRWLAERQPPGTDAGGDVLYDLARRLVAGERVRIPWPVKEVTIGDRNPVILELSVVDAVRLGFKVSRSKAYELLDRHGKKHGRLYTLSREGWAGIADEMRPVEFRRFLVSIRMRESGSTRQSAERWVRRYLERHPDADKISSRTETHPVDTRSDDPIERTRKLEQAIREIARYDPTLVRFD